MTTDLIHYTDLKSPYAFLAWEETDRIAEDYDINLIVRPYTLDIPSYLDEVEDRTPHHWRRVKYAYMDCRRTANRRGLTLYGPKKIYDTRMINTAMLFARDQGLHRPFIGNVFTRFFRREINVESMDDVVEALEQAGVNPSGFAVFLDGPGGEEHDSYRAEAEARGIFGVPSYILGDELYWGGENLPHIRTQLDQMGVARKAR